MPGHSGFDLARELRRWRGTRGQRIAAIAISALSAPGIRQVALAAGFQEYFVKPFDTWTLVGAVETLHAMSIAHLRT
jgi:CheY-like chemotaxis protein